MADTAAENAPGRRLAATVGRRSAATPVFYLSRVVEIPHRRPRGHARGAPCRPPSRSSRRCARSGPRAAPLDRRPRHGARRRRRRRRHGRRPRRPHRRRLPAAQRDPATGSTRRVHAARRRDAASTLDFTVMTDEEREALRIRLHGDPAATAGHGHGPRPRRGPGDPLRRARLARPGRCSSRRARAASASRSVTTNLAVALAQQGHSVGVVDADIYGFSIPRMLGTDREPVVIDEMLVPPEAGACAASRSATSCPRARPSSGGARCCTRRSSSSSPTSTGTTPTSCSSTCRPAPATSPLSLSQYLPRGEVLRRHHAAAGGPEGRPAVGGDGREGQPAGARA